MIVLQEGYAHMNIKNFQIKGDDYAQMLAREELAVAGIPTSIAERLRLAQGKFVANGGCPGCGSMVLGVHMSGCNVYGDDLY